MDKAYRNFTWPFGPFPELADYMTRCGQHSQQKQGWVRAHMRCTLYHSGIQGLNEVL